MVVGEEKRETHEVKVEIVQTWYKIDIVFISPFSRSRITVASFDASNTKNVVVKYIYNASPTKPLEYFQYPAEGVAEFFFSSEGKVSGSWYSLKDWYGVVELHKI